MFMDEDFLLNNETARRLYHDVAEGLPIIDYHCHVNPRELYEDKCYANITQAWLTHDPYKWRLMRLAGVSEDYITGKADDEEKFMKWAAILGKAIGHPLYHWSHLELLRYFGYEGSLNANTAREVWEMTNRKLQHLSRSPRNLIARANVEALCTTDDPVDSLDWHRRLAEDQSFKTAVLPTWRPDRAMNLERPDYLVYLRTLELVTGVEINSFHALKDALWMRMSYFHERGCRRCDHALNTVTFMPTSNADIEDIFRRRLAGQIPTEEDENKFKYALLHFSAAEYTNMGWTMQLHFGCRRDVNGLMYSRVGRDAGFECVDNDATSAQIAAFLDDLQSSHALPRTLLYSLNPSDNAAIDSILGCFQDDEIAYKVQHGPAWWFNNHFRGIVEHMRSLAARGYLPGFIGMTSDSRSLLSFPRHEYFRRTLCRVIGEWVEDDMYPRDMDALSEIVRDICYGNAKRYFAFEEKR